VELASAGAPLSGAAIAAQKTGKHATNRERKRKLTRLHMNTIGRGGTTD
jgi:hypothetical protein